jgi:hypothetical protein
MIILQVGDIIRGTAPNPHLYLWLVLAVIGVIALIVVGMLISRRSRPQTAADVQQYSSAIFRRAGKAMGLTPAHLDVLENLVRMCKVKQPLLVYSSAGLLDDTLKKGLYSLDNARDLS